MSTILPLPEPRYIILPLVSCPIWDTPRSQALGAIKRRNAIIGKPLLVYDILVFDGGVEYAWLVPQDPTRDEWVRMAEAGGTPKYADRFPITSSGADASTNTLISVLREIKNAIEQLAQ